MKKYERLKKEKLEKFKRMAGISPDNFQTLYDKTATYIKEETERNRLKQRGLKTSKLCLADRILLTLYYLRHYPTILRTVFVSI